MANKNYLKDYYQKNRERLTAKARARYQANRIKILEKSRLYHLQNRDRHLETSKEGHYRRKFGLSLEERNKILARGCQICYGDATHIDHDHITNKVRGGLCNNCNTGLGMFQDNEKILRDAILYLQGAR